jgi:hypothetical protein
VRAQLSPARASLCNFPLAALVVGLSIVAFATAGFFTPVFASQIRTLNLEQLTGHADRIFHGRCLSVTVGTDPDLGQTVTYVTFSQYRAMKGSFHGKLTVKLLGNQTSQAGPAEATEGIPRFEAGEEVVLFLYGESARGLTSPVGFGQGKFKVVKDKSRIPQAINGFSNERLLDGLSSAAQAKLGARVEHLHGRRPIPLDDFLEMVQSLAR